MTVWAMVDFLQAMKDYPMLLDSDMARRMVRSGQAFCKGYQWLNTEAVDQGRCRYNIVPTHHYYCHAFILIGKYIYKSLQQMVLRG